MEDKKIYLVVAFIFVISIASYFLSEEIFSIIKIDQSSSSNNSQISKVDFINVEFGFSLSLPESWRGYKVVLSKWQGFDVNSTFEKPAPTETGPVISVRHPLWTEDKPRQDIPIMVFTIAQWEKVAKEELSVSAAPIPPTELGRNTKYIFALPARYNYAFPEGFEEVEKIIQGKNFNVF